MKSIKKKWEAHLMKKENANLMINLKDYASLD